MRTKKHIQKNINKTKRGGGKRNNNNKKKSKKTKRQFLYNANFALRHSDSEVAPYIAITDLKESKKIMDTIYKSLSDDIKKSKYAKNLKKLLSI